MSSLSKWLIPVVAVCCLTVLGSEAKADLNFSFTGTFAHDNDVQLFNFTVGATSNVTVRSWSYAGGTNAAGTTIAEGGFDPILAVFNSSGVLIGQNDDGGSSVSADAVTGQRWDTFLQITNLAAGSYTASVMQYDNFANGPNLSDGFREDGNISFTQRLTGQTSGNFWDVTDHERDSHWAFDILNVAQASTVSSVPEPSTMIVALGGVAAGLGVCWRRRCATAAA